ncbi:unnamed protein product [Brassica napus]|uniref:(rape) hypothetical protein n=1 Tax=Brassica napus TaxID=3708 RepID=A0A816ITR7_BRANA|nr:unnamed protein product [Brassica napus]
MSGSKNSVRKWKVLDHVDSDDVLFAFCSKKFFFSVFRQHSCSGLLMLTTVNAHRLTTYVTRRNQNFILPESPLLIRFNDSTTLDEITDLPY